MGGGSESVWGLSPLVSIFSIKKIKPFLWEKKIKEKINVKSWVFVYLFASKMKKK